MLGPEFAALMQRACAGDGAAFSVIWRDINPALVRYLRVLSSATAEDCASDTWLEAVKHWADFDGDEPALRAWIFTIGRRKVIDSWRKTNRRPVVLVNDLDSEPWHEVVPSAEEVAGEHFSTDDAIALIATLPRDQAEVIMLRVVAGLETAEVAAIVGSTVGAVRVRQHRALKTLRERLVGEDSNRTSPAATSGVTP